MQISDLTSSKNQQTAKQTRTRQKLLIIGSGMATARLLETLVSLDHPYDIQVVGEEPQPSYNRILLSSLLAQEKEKSDLPLLDESWYREHQISLITDEHIKQVDLDAKLAISVAGSSYSFDKLVFATGSRAMLPAMPGIDLDGVMGFRNQSDVKRMTRVASQGGKAVVVGGGLLGLEAAHGLNKLGMDVTVVHRRGWLMNRQLDEASGKILRDQLAARGIAFEMSTSPKAIHGAEQFETLELDNGTELSGDLLVFAAGINPNKEIAEHAGLKSQYGICIDGHMQTSMSDVYALGECAELDGMTFGLVAPVWEQAETLAEVLCGNNPAAYSYSDAPTQLKVSGIELFSAGNTASKQSDDDLLMCSPNTGMYRRLIIEGNQLKGAILLGNRSSGSWYNELIQDEMDISAIRSFLMFGKDAIPDDLKDQIQKHTQVSSDSIAA